MAPNESSTSADNSKPTAANFIPNCAALLLSSPKFTPFPKASPSSSSSKKLNLIPQNLHTSILSATTNFLTKLHTFASQNPLLNKLIHFQNQIRYERHKSANLISTRNFAAVLPGDSVAGIVVTNGILNFLNLYNTVLIVRLVLTWFPNAPSAIVAPLSTVCDPYLNIFRGIIPPLGGTLDLSPILAFLVLNVFTSTASALPAELPATEHRSSASQARSSGVTSSQQKWLRRIHGGGVGTKKSSSDSH